MKEAYFLGTIPIFLIDFVLIIFLTTFGVWVEAHTGVKALAGIPRALPLSVPLKYLYTINRWQNCILSICGDYPLSLDYLNDVYPLHNCEIDQLLTLVYGCTWVACLFVYVSVFVHVKFFTPSDNSLDVDRGFLASCLLCVCLSYVLCLFSYCYWLKINVSEIEIEIEIETNW